MNPGSSLSIKAFFNTEEAEKLLDEISLLSDPKKEITLDLRALKKVDIGAGYRLGNALRKLSEFSKLIVLLSEEEFSNNKPSSHWFLQFTRSGLGPAISTHAHSIFCGEIEVKQLLQDYYSKTLEVPTQNLVYFTGLHLGRLDVENESAFMRRMLQQFPFVQIPTQSFSDETLGSLTAMCFEAAQNAVDHANKKPLSSTSKIFSYLSLRYYKGTDKPNEGAFSSYLRRVEEKFGGKGNFRLLEIVINDDGVGIPARESGNLDIYRDDVSKEESALNKALLGSNVKLREKDSKIRGGITGQGYKRIPKSLKQLQAFASLRTGRCFSTFDGSSPVRDSFQLTKGRFGLQPPYMPGTTLQVIVPFSPNKDQDTNQQSLF